MVRNPKFTTIAVTHSVKKDLKQLSINHDLSSIKDAILLLLKHHKKRCKKC